LDTERCVRQRFEPSLGDGFAAACAVAVLAGVEASQGLIDLVELGRGLVVEVIPNIGDFPELRVVVLPLGDDVDDEDSDDD